MNFFKFQHFESLSKRSTGVFRFNLGFFVAALLLCQPVQAKLYKWVDAQGNIFYSDQVPPSESQREHKVLDSSGVTRDTKEAAKTKEEIAREAELKRRRDEQQRLAEDQKRQDQQLLMTFQNEDEIFGTRDGKLKAVDAKIEMLRGNIRGRQMELANRQAQALRLTQQKKPVPAKVTKDIETFNQQIAGNYRDILQLEQQKQDIRLAYAKDLARFRELKGTLGGLGENGQTEADATSSTLLLDNLLVCKEDCDALWRQVAFFVRKHTKTEIQVVGDNIIASKPPRLAQEIALTVSRNRNPDGTQEFFLDVRCVPISGKQTPCSGEEGKKILEAFHALSTK